MFEKVAFPSEHSELEPQGPQIMSVALRCDALFNGVEVSHSVGRRVTEVQAFSWQMRRRYLLIRSYYMGALTIAKKALWLCGCAWGAGNGACFVALVTQREDPIIF